MRNKREVVYDPKGNIRLTFSDETIKLGTIKIDEIMDNIGRVCSTQGQCDSTTIDLKGQLISTDEVISETLSISPDGAYPTWIHNGLVDGLRAAVHAVAKCEDTTHKPSCGFSPYYCPAKPFTVNQCVIPRYIGINYQAPDCGNCAPPNIGARLEMKLDEGGFCKTLLESAGTVAGAINGYAGGFFTLLSMACKD
ncbi:hypothetical protein BCR34DRAFT_585137 [Clohesyomyces aquaticus]|uniref:Uncharacterized protein n=1 Tax=Clohesyomyces aquaticus TaxID=1231657 RepID=A0A1Y1ZYB6_9PLEO|nr:hypothetical protein BCR34DRAFT_585137 [Clohesyomyces aquaticus]